MVFAACGVKTMLFNEERVFAVSNERTDLAKFALAVRDDEVAQQEKTGKSSDWRDVDLSGVDWHEVWAMVAEVEDANECGDSCTL